MGIASISDFLIFGNKVLKSELFLIQNHFPNLLFMIPRIYFSEYLSSEPIRL